MDCEECKKKRSETGKTVPYGAFELQAAQHERRTRLIIIALIIAIIGIIVSNALWLYAWCQYDYTSTTEEIIVNQDTSDGGSANYIGRDGDILYGTSDCNK